MALNDTMVIFTGEIYSSDTNSYLLGFVIQTRDLQQRRPKKWNINFFSSFHDFFCASDPVFIQDRRVGITGGGANRGGTGTSLCDRACSQSNRNMEQNCDGMNF